MNLVRLLDASSEALSLAEVRTQLRITVTDDDDAFRLFIAAIRQETETYLRQTLVTSTWELKLDSFEDQIELPMYPIQSISSIEYVDNDGASQTLASTEYQFDRKGRIKPAYSKSWPDTRDQYDAVTITYIAGETNPGQVSDDIKLAMLLWIGACDLNRENVIIGVNVSEIPNSAKNILDRIREWQ